MLRQAGAHLCAICRGLENAGKGLHTSNFEGMPAFQFWKELKNDLSEMWKNQ